MITCKTLTNAISRHENNMNKSMSNISSGTVGITDNPAGAQISSKMESKINGTNVAIKNAQDGISLLQTADGALSDVHSILQRMNEIAVSSANGTHTDEDRAALNMEFVELTKQISEILTNTEFNDKALFVNGNNGGSNKVILQVGADSNNTIEIDLGHIDLKSLGLDSLDISTQEGASNALDVLKSAINTISSKRSYVGAYVNRIESTISSLEKYSENLSNAKSRITDTDMAKEIIKYTKENILVQSNIGLLQMYLEVSETNAKSLLSSFL